MALSLAVGRSAREVADKLQMPKAIVHARASMYRSAGIRLKKMQRHRTKALDVEGLNKVIAEIDKKMGRVGGEENAPARKKPQLDVEPADTEDIVRKVALRVLVWVTFTASVACR